MGSHKILIFCFDKITTTTKKHFYIYMCVCDCDKGCEKSWWIFVNCVGNYLKYHVCHRLVYRGQKKKEEKKSQCAHLSHRLQLLINKVFNEHCERCYM